MRPVALIIILSLVLFVPIGCSRRAAAPAPRAKPTAVAQTPLPDWAPKNPSLEFLRAARVLRTGEKDKGGPPPPDTPQTVEDLAGRAFSTHYGRTLVPTWELFGTLSDEQVAQFLATDQVRLPVKSLSKKQRDLLERYFAVWRREMKDMPERETEWGKDWLVDLYKGGARQDLSNVLLTFQTKKASRRVAMILYVVKPDGTLSHPFPAGIADLAQSRDRALSAGDRRTTQDRREKQER